jgi:V/A-type H+-transporting ATPase subunit D
MIKRSFSELLRIRKDRELATRGADVLEKVETTLTKDLLSLDSQIKSINSEIASMMDDISRELREAKEESMLVDIENAIAAEPLDNGFSFVAMKKFGKLISQMERKQPAGSTPKWGASLAYERAREISKKMLMRIVDLGNAQMQREFVAQELAKTRRRVNALRRIIIPDLDSRQKILDEWMDEEIREELGRRLWSQEVAGS